MHLPTIGVVQNFCLLLKLAQTTGAENETVNASSIPLILPALVLKTFFGPLHPSVSFLLRRSSKPVGWQPSSQCGAAPALSSPRGPWRAAVQPRNSVLYFPVRQTPLLSGVGPSAVTTSRRQATFDSASSTAHCLSQRRLLLCGCNRVAQHGDRSSKRGDEGCACVGVCAARAGLGIAGFGGLRPAPTRGFFSRWGRRSCRRTRTRDPQGRTAAAAAMLLAAGHKMGATATAAALSYNMRAGGAAAAASAPAGLRG